jgi:hypothetical protein
LASNATLFATTVRDHHAPTPQHDLMDEPNFEEEIDMIVNSFNRNIVDKEHDIEISHCFGEDKSSHGASTSKR